jgi:LCP family protein required for cell wall assembly
MQKKSNKKWILIPLAIVAFIVAGAFIFYMVFYSNLGKKYIGSKFLGSFSACSPASNMTLLLIGVDYRGDDYLYGLADVIRLADVDFSNQSVNMVALPRDLLVEIPPDRFKVPGPYKINQAYFFGTPGMQNYVGEGEGPAALNEVIEYNFGVSADHYLVFNFKVFVDFIDAIGGVDVNLPEPVYGGDQGQFPAGEQTLNGTQALALSRLREGYSDDFRVRNQSIIIKAITRKLMQPAMMLKYPQLIAEFKDSVLTDLPFDQLSGAALCFQGFDSDNLVTKEVPEELLAKESVFLPSLNEYSFVYRWDGRLVEWIESSLKGDG